MKLSEVKEIIIHCSATVEGRDYSVADIDRWHRARGFAKVGYHYIICRDGSVHQGRSTKEVGAHCKGHNSFSIGVCYIGGVDKDGKHPKDTRTPQQKDSLRALLEQLREDYPQATIHGHYEFANKACPCFKIPDDL